MGDDKRTTGATPEELEETVRDPSPADTDEDLKQTVQEAAAIGDTLEATGDGTADTTAPDDSGAAPTSDVWGLMVEFDDVPALIDGATKVRDAGFRHWDCHTPFPVHGLNDAMGLKLTKLPLVTLAGGLTGVTGALLMQWWMNAYDYPIIISGKPLWSIPANIPVAFEATILLAALSTFIGMLAFNNLPMHNHPLMTRKRFRRATDDRFFISIEASDPRFDYDTARALADDLGGVRVEVIEEEG